MMTKSLFVSALVASAAIASAAAAPVGNAKSGIQRRCFLGSCSTTNNSKNDNTSNVNTSNTENVSNNSNESGSGNQITTGNNRGGNSFGNIKAGGGMCSRAYFEGKKRALEHHLDMVTRDQQTAVNQWSSQHDKTNFASNNSKTTINASTNQGNSFAGNQGQIVGSGNVNHCRRELQELEMEARELDTGASVLAAIGGHHVRAINDQLSYLATRDLGRLAEALGVRASGHDADSATHYKRDIGLECAVDGCDDLLRRQAEEILAVHARDLGFFVESL